MPARRQRSDGPDTLEPQRYSTPMSRSPRRRTAPPTPTELRIIGGAFRGRKLEYHGDPVTRPMKHRTREAIFNLISTASKGRRAIDLFAGTGALGLEAISRGACWGTFIEKHVPTSRVIERNIAALGVEDRAELLTTSAFLWAKRDLPAGATPKSSGAAAQPGEEGDRRSHAAATSDAPWLVFCSPPYSFFVERRDEMLALIDAVREHCPADSVLVVEADERFDFGLLTAGLPSGEETSAWDVRTYMPAVVGVWRKGPSA